MMIDFRNTEPLRIAVVGAGAPNIATSCHLPAISQLPNVELVALCDTNEAGVRQEAAKWDVPYYTDFKDLLDNDRVQAVDICTPDWCHCEQTVMAANAGIHVLCEKPIALTMDESEQMAKAVRTAGVIFMAGHQMRFSSIYQKAREAVATGSIGEIVYGRIAAKGAYYPYPEDSRYRKKETGGQFVHNGAHLVDSLFFVLGMSEPSSIFARSKSVYPNEQESLETDNFTSVMLEFDNGAIASIEQNLTILNPRGCPTKQELLVIGTKGSISCSSIDNAAIIKYSGGNVTIADPPASIIGDDPFVQEIGCFTDCVKSGIEPEINIDFAQRVLGVCLAPNQNKAEN